MKKTYTIKDLKKYASLKKGQCLSDEYINSYHKYKWKCSKDHVWEANWNNVLSKNNWCRECSKDIMRSVNLKYSINNLKKYAERKEGKCISETYLTDKDKYLWKCAKDHTWEARWADIKKNHWCPTCGNITRAKSKTKYNIEQLQRYASSMEGVCLDTKYRGLNAYYMWKCSKDHIWKSKWTNIIHEGCWCPTCSLLKVRSKAEEEIEQFLLDNNIKTINNYRPPFLEGKELDLFIPELNLAIEYHGLVWHSERFTKNISSIKTIHEFKYLKCKENNITLIQIFQDEWEHKQDIVKSILLNKLNLVNNIFARKTQIINVTAEQEKTFFDENHITGYTRSIYCIGLTYKDELVACLSLRKPFTKQASTLEIARFAVKKRNRVIGGFSKLLKHVIFTFKEEYNKILTYADCRFGSGKVYSKCGFTYIGKTKPNYFYEKAGIRENRFKHRKINDLDYINKFGPTEREQNNNQGRYAIYDAGNEKYEYYLTYDIIKEKIKK